MIVQFLIPPTFDKKQRPAERSAGCTRIVYPFPNIYELTAAACLREEGFDVRLEDFIYENRTVDSLEAFIKDCPAQIYCIWGVNLSIEDDVKTIKMILGMHEHAYVLMMGPAPTFFPEKFLFSDNVIIVRGEPELTLVDVAKRIRDNADWHDAQGIIYRGDDGKIKRNASRPLIKDLDILPFPARDLLGDREYHNPKLKCGPYTTVLTSRNCPYQCIYCVPSSLTFARELDFKNDNKRKPPISYRTAENLDAELSQLHAQGYKAIGFVDDEFIWTEQRTKELCQVIGKYGFVWGCQARVDAITENIAAALAEAGCRYVDLGVESFNDDILKYIKKGITSDQIYKAIEILKKYKIPVKLNILIGTAPFETKETVRDTIRKAKKLDVDQVMVNIVSPFPGTVFYEQALKNGWIVNDEYRPTNVQRESILNYPHLSAKDMENLLFWENIRFFLSPRFIFKQMRRFTSYKEFKASIKALKIKLFG